jgi:exopolyphosphatase/guanosine-5'-triphosphate,3'-diphosphate pyrophosphatase
MQVAVIDVGSNTIRMLIASGEGGALARVRERKSRIGLGADVELTGRISREKLVEASSAVALCTAEARSVGCRRIEIVAASPGRQAENAGELIRVLARAGRAPVRVLSQEEEARLAFHGAIASGAQVDETVAVCDVGGGSTQIAFGTPVLGPVWLRSVDLGSLRLTVRRLDDDPPGKKAFAEARAEVRAAFDGVAVPLPKSALAVGGTARALRRLAGGRLGGEELESALRTLRKQCSAEVARRYGVEPSRARTLPGGALIVAELNRRLGIPLEVASGGIREGLASSLLDELAAA